MARKSASSEEFKSSSEPVAVRIGDTSTVSIDKLKSIVGIMILVVSVFALGLMGGRLLGNDVARVSTDRSRLFNFQGDLNDSESRIAEGSIDFDLYWEIWNTMKYQYVDEKSVDEKEMFYGSIKGMVNSYGDPATIFLDPDETEAFTKGSAGNYFSGIGAELGYRENRVVVIAPLGGSPAEAAGMKAGDIITSIDGEDLKSNETIYDIVMKIRGERGTDVKIKVFRPSDNSSKDFTIKRGDITVPSMSYEESDKKGVYIIDISRFTEASMREWTAKWDETVDSVLAEDPKAVVIDLRGNPGGYFDAAVYAAEEFLEKDTVVAMQQDRAGKKQVYKVKRNGRLKDIPVIVLVNEGSASASEILAGALQSSDRAKIVGVNTYGKGTAQSIIDYPDGSSLHITVLIWLLPDGTWLNKDNPIIPNKVVEISDEQFKAGEDPQLEEALKLVR